MVDKETLTRLYITDGLSLKDVAAALGMNYSAVRAAMIREQVPIRSKHDGILAQIHKWSTCKVGRKRPHTQATKDRMRESAGKRWSGKAKGTRITSSGYVEYTTGPHKGRSVHDVFMEQKIGRPLQPNEVVHHDDEDRQNNAEENLFLMTRSEHAALHRAREKAKKELEHGFIA